MKTFFVTVAVLLLMLPFAYAGDPTRTPENPQGHAGCPADRAAELGHDPFDAFHAVVAPAWHDAWPNKDYDALLAAGPKFQAAFADIAKMEPGFKSEKRLQTFTKARKDFGDMVSAYAAAAKEGDKDLVYELMPRLHDAFEYTASTLLPVSFPEIESVAIALDLILNTHLPKDNYEGVVGSTETLLAKFVTMSDSTCIPDELMPNREAIMAEIAAMTKIALLMKDCCDKEDMEQYKEHAARLDVKLKAFFETYI